MVKADAAEKYVTWGVNEISRPCGPRGKDRPSRICADQVPSELNVTNRTVKFADSPSIENVRVGFSGFPLLSDKPVPLLEVSDPVTLKGSQGRGLAWIGSINMVTGDLMVIVFRI